MDSTANEKKATTAAAGKPQRFIYVGPSLAGGVLVKATVFKGGYPQNMAEILKKYPLIKLLFAAPIDAAATEEKMNTKGTPENEALKQIYSGGVLNLSTEEGNK